MIIIGMALCQGCFQLDVPLYGSLRSDPGVRVYQSEDQLIINITHPPGTEPVYNPTKIIQAVIK